MLFYVRTEQLNEIIRDTFLAVTPGTQVKHKLQEA